MSARWESAGLHLPGNRTQSRRMLKKATFSPAQPRRAKTRLTQARPQASRNRRRYRPHFVGPFAVQWILVNGKTPPVWPTSENLNRYVEDFDEPRTTLAGFFSILLRSRWKLVRQERHIFLFESEMDDQEDDPHADRRVGDIEGRPMVGIHIDIEKIDHLAIP